MSALVPASSPLTRVAAGSTIPALALGSLALAQPVSASAATPAPQQVKVGASAVKQPAAPTPLRKRVPASVTVKAGDTIYGIAQRYGLNPQKLLKLNRLKANSLIFPGQRIVLRAGKPVTVHSASKYRAKTSALRSKRSYAGRSYTVRAGDSLSVIAARAGMSVQRLAALNGLSLKSTIFPGQKLRLSAKSAAARQVVAWKKRVAKKARTGSWYTIKSGDTLSGIAARHGISLQSLLRTNRLSTSSLIVPGQKVKIRGVRVAAQRAVVKRAKATQRSKQRISANFLHYVYPQATVDAANRNNDILQQRRHPSPAQMRTLIVRIAQQMGVNPKLALGHARTESGLRHASVSPANAVGVMQVIPSSGRWASDMVGRKLNLLDPVDNVTAGVAIIRYLQRNARSMDEGIAGYYQGLGGVQQHGMYPDTKDYVRKVRANMH